MILDVLCKMNADQAADLMRKSLASHEFNEVAKWLRSEVSGVRMDFLRERINHSAILRLAMSCVNDRGEAQELFRLGLDSIMYANSQKTKLWTQFGVTKIGAKRAITEISNRVDSQPHVVDMALYWLPSMIPEGDSSRDSLVQLQNLAKRLDLIKPVRKTVHEDGSITFSDRYGNL